MAAVAAAENVDTGRRRCRSGPNAIVFACDETKPRDIIAWESKWVAAMEAVCSVLYAFPGSHGIRSTALVIFVWG